MRFVILSRYRSGSTLLARSLHAHPAVSVREEAFNVGNLARNTRLLDDPAAALESLFGSRETGGASGFKLMYGQATRAELAPGYWHPGPNRSIARAIGTIESYIRDDRERYLGNLEVIWRRLRDDAAVGIVHLVRRDPLAAYLSFVLAMTDDLWVGAPYRTRQVEIDPARCESWVEEGEAQRRRYIEMFASHPTVEIVYEELAADPSGRMRDVLEFLGVEPRELAIAIPKQQRRPLREVIKNYDAVRRHLEGTALRDALP